MRDESKAIIPRDPQRGKALAVAAALRSIASDMNGISAEMGKLDAPNPVNSCKLRGQAALLKEWADNLERVK